MIPLSEQLSQLWSGELSDAEALALRHRIATEPEVASQWARLGVAMEALATLPDAIAPPPLRPRAPAPRSFPGWAAVPLLLAAAALLWVLPMPQAPEILLASGSQWVDGTAEVLAGNAVVEVDGKVWISVEPVDPPLRVGGHNREVPMNKSTIIASLAGAVITVVVYEGTAVVRAAPDAPGVLVSAGGTHTEGLGNRVRTQPPAGTLSPEARAAHIAQLQGELDAVQQALAEAQFEGALTRGQLAAIQGTPSPWPADVPAAFTPERFRAELEANLEGLADVSVAEVDCSEYPCVAAIEYTGSSTSDDWNKPMAEAVRGWAEGELGDKLSLNVNTSRFRKEHDGVVRTSRYIIFGAHSDGGEGEGDVGTRTDFRIDAMVDELGQRLSP